MSYNRGVKETAKCLRKRMAYCPWTFLRLMSQLQVLRLKFVIYLRMARKLIFFEKFFVNSAKKKYLGLEYL